MNITAEDIKATLIRLQGQIDVWQGLYQEVLKLDAAKPEAKNDPVTKG